MQVSILQFKGFQAEGQTMTTHAGIMPDGSRSHPRTLILEKDSTARPVVGRPMEVAGRNVVKISMFFDLRQQFLGLHRIGENAVIRTRPLESTSASMTRESS